MKKILLVFALVFSINAYSQDSTGKFTLKFTDAELGLLWEIIESSNFSHKSVKDMQQFIRNQIAVQQVKALPPKQQDSTIKKPIKKN